MQGAAEKKYIQVRKYVRNMLKRNLAMAPTVPTLITVYADAHEQGIAVTAKPLLAEVPPPAGQCRMLLSPPKRWGN